MPNYVLRVFMFSPIYIMGYTGILSASFSKGQNSGGLLTNLTLGCSVNLTILYDYKKKLLVDDK